MLFTETTCQRYEKFAALELKNTRSDIIVSNNDTFLSFSGMTSSSQLSSRCENNPGK